MYFKLLERRIRRGTGQDFKFLLDEFDSAQLFDFFQLRCEPNRRAQSVDVNLRKTSYTFIKSIYTYQNMLPLPSGLGRKPIFPPISSAKLLHMLRPKPVPLYRFVAELSYCVNGVKSVFDGTAGIPIPLSITSVRIVYDSSSSACSFASIRTYPSSVNLIALERRFWTICL